VSFAHDLGGLAVAREATAPLVIVVIDNQGGRLFEQLPIASAAPPAVLERFWLTPPRVDLAAAAAAFAIPYRRVDGAAALSGALAGALERPGAALLQVDVDPHGAAAQRAALAEAVEAALAAEGSP
jgi:2-succinyl-5-enolpyruvyl-6-hydroxy-3-cyclohexene-1-carboxylate synthase